MSEKSWPRTTAYQNVTHDTVVGPIEQTCRLRNGKTHVPQ